MEKEKIISFFDKLAPVWDSEQIRNEEVIGIILDKGAITKGADILDVACGTGVLFSDYKSREVASVTGIDISGEMVKTAKDKFPFAEIICGDAEFYRFSKKFDSVMIYNAFPHFGNPEALIKNLSDFIRPGGRLSVAHGISMEELEKCHSGKAREISLPLPEKEKVAEFFAPYFNVDTMISDSKMYMVSGTKK